MEMSSLKRTRSEEETNDDNSPEAINAIVRLLSTPTDHQPTNVSKMYSNDVAQGNEVKAYAKIAGQNWTYFVKELKVTIGRNAESFKVGDKGGAEIDLGPSKVVSRNHAVIEYNLQRRCWELFITGRNGLKVNGYRLNVTPNTPYELNSGNIIDIGGTQMMFILPDSPPVIPDYFRGLLNKKHKAGEEVQAVVPNSSKDIVLTDQVRAFQLREGVSLPEDSNNATNKDLSKDECKGVKPPFSYATMITQAILSNPQGILSLSEIYDWIASHFAYYRHTKQGWQNSIRHNLSLNKAFEKVPRKPNEPGKGMKWQISEAYRKDFMNKWRDGSLSKMKRGTSVSRQLQLHLIKNNALPQGRPSEQLPPPASARTTQFNTHQNTSPGQLPQPHLIPSRQQQQQQQQHQLPPLMQHHVPLIEVDKLPSPLKNLNNVTADTNGNNRYNGSPTKNIPSFQSPVKKQLMHSPELMTPERGTRHLDPPLGLQGSTNSSPALWNYVQFSTPLGTDKKNGAFEPQSMEKSGIPHNTTRAGSTSERGEMLDLQKVDLDSPLKNRKVIQVDDLKNLKDV